VFVGFGHGWGEKQRKGCNIKDKGANKHLIKKTAGRGRGTPCGRWAKSRDDARDQKGKKLVKKKTIKGCWFQKKRGANSVGGGGEMSTGSGCPTKSGKARTVDRGSVGIHFCLSLGAGKQKSQNKRKGSELSKKKGP